MATNQPTIRLLETLYTQLGRHLRALEVELVALLQSTTTLPDDETHQARCTAMCEEIDLLAARRHAIKHQLARLHAASEAPAPAGGSSPLDALRRKISLLEQELASVLDDVERERGPSSGPDEALRPAEARGLAICAEIERLAELGLSLEAMLRGQK